MVAPHGSLALRSPYPVCRNMEVDGHPLPDRQTDGGATHAMTEVTVINGEADAHLPKVF